MTWMLIGGRRGPLLGAIVIAAIGLSQVAPTPAHAGGEAGEVAVSAEDFTGVYHYAGGDREERAIAAAVDDATAELNPMLKPLARKLLHKAAVPTREFRVTVTDTGITIGSPSKKKGLITAPRDGSALRWRGPDGARYDVRHQLRGDHILQRFQGVANKSDTKKVFRLSPDGKRLTISITIKHPMMPKVLKYRQTYRRR